MADLAAAFAGWDARVLQLIHAARDTRRWALVDRSPLARCNARTITSATAFSNAASVAALAFCTPLILRTYCRAAASISSWVAWGSSPRRVVMLRHMPSKIRQDPKKDTPSPATSTTRVGASGSPGSGGNGTMNHLVGQLLARTAGITLQHVPYRGSAAAMTDLMGGQVDLLCDQT